MSSASSSLLLLSLLVISGGLCDQLRKPHIVFVLIDDLGWNDLSFRGTDVSTPNIDALAKDAVLLNHYYVYPICTPSRAAIFTGRYTHNIGMQHFLIRNGAPWGLPLNLRILPQHLKSLGYSTALIGKWHLGFHEKAYTPLERGFDYHFGYWTATMDYYDHTSVLGVKLNDADLSKCGINREDIFLNGSAMVENTYPVTDKIGEYSTDVFNEKTRALISEHTPSKPLFLYLAPTAVHRGNFFKPVKSPDAYTDQFEHIQNETRRQFAGNVKALDVLIGDLFKALDDKGMLSQSIIVLSSDNGADASRVLYNGGSNWPLRGEKFTAFEGGVRTLGLVWSPLINGRTDFNYLAHASDWLPTLYSAAGGDVKDLGIVDGHNLWNVLGTSEPGPRDSVVIDLDTVAKRGAYRDAQYKLLYGTYPPAHTTGWHGRPEFVSIPQTSTIQNILKKYDQREAKPEPSADRVNCGPKMESADLACVPAVAPCLFDLQNDPCEYHNIASQHPQKVASILSEMKEHERVAYPVQFRSVDPESHPRLYGYRWVSWRDPEYILFRSNLPLSYRDNLCTTKGPTEVPL